MKMLIKEFADFTGVSVRTLHYYNEIGLLNPAIVDEQTGYRFYDEKSVLRMQEILFYRELDFSLKSILEILSSPNYDKQKALKEQKNLLTLKKERLERLIAAVDDAVKGEQVMNAFDNSKYEAARKQYEQEAKEKWGGTEAYEEYQEKSKNYSSDTMSGILAGLEDVFEEFAVCMKDGKTSDSEEAQGLVKKLQGYITDNFYTCTKEILDGLGLMYVGDERFKAKIDKHGEGTAEYVSRAIDIYCK